MATARRRWGFLLLVVPYLAARVAVITGNTRVGVWYDTTTYAVRPGSGVRTGDLVSLTGDAPRLWGTPLFFALFDGDIQRARAQWAVSTAAFVLLAWGLWQHLANVVVRVLAVAAVMVMSLARQVASWDLAILSEPLSISLGILAFAGLLLWLRDGRWWGWSVMVAAAFLWLFVRVELVLAVAALTCGLAVVAGRVRTRRRQAVAAVLVLVVGAGWATAITPSVDRAFRHWSFTGFVQREELFALRAAYRIFPDPDLYRVYREMGMPECPEAMAHLGPGAERRERFLAAYARCPRLRAWGVEHANAATVEAALRDPGAFARQFRADQRELISSNPVRYGASRWLLPIPVEQAFFPPRAGPRILVTFWGGLLLGVALVVVCGALRRRPVLAWAGLGATAVTLGLLAFSELFSATEPIRFGSQEAIYARILAVTLVAAGADALVARFRAARPDARAAAADAVTPVVAAPGATPPPTRP
jgi:hypothetical protein